MRNDIRNLFAAAAVAAFSGCGGGDDIPASAPAPAAAPSPSPAPAAPAPAPVVNTSTAVSGTTAYGVLGTTTARVAFVASGKSVTPVLIESDGSVHISSAAPVGHSTALATPAIVPTVPLSFSASACAVDSNDLMGICIGFTSPMIAVLDLSVFATSFKVGDITVKEFDSGAGKTPNQYSGGSCILCGVAPDIGKKRFVVGGAGGFRVFDYASTTASAVYNLPVGENFAFLSQPGGQSYVIAPEYEPSGNGQRKLRVINVDNGKAYTWTKNTDSVADLGPSAVNFQSSDVDAAAVDLTTKIIALSSESSADFLLVDFGQATFDESALTFDAPFAFAQPSTGASLSRLTDVAISTTGNILLSHGEGASNIGVTQLPTASGSGRAFPNGLGALGTFDLNDPNFDRTPCGPSYSFTGKFDPHGLGLYAGLDKGQRGLVVDSANTCAAVIELAAMVSAPALAAQPNEVDTSNAAVKAAVKFVKLN